MEPDTANGHIEAVVKRTIVDGARVYAGMYSMGGDTATEYDQVLLASNRLKAYHNSQAASQRMVDDADAKAQLTVYQHLDAVGVRTPGSNPRKCKTHHSLPCLVVDVDSRAFSAGTRTVVHSLYTLWCPHDVLYDKGKVDKLVNMSINNFAALAHLRDERLTPQQRLARSDSNSHGCKRLGTSRASASRMLGSSTGRCTSSAPGIGAGTALYSLTRRRTRQPRPSRRVRQTLGRRCGYRRSRISPCSFVPAAPAHLAASSRSWTPTKRSTKCCGVSRQRTPAFTRVSPAGLTDEWSTSAWSGHGADYCSGQRRLAP